MLYKGFWWCPSSYPTPSTSFVPLATTDSAHSSHELLPGRLALENMEFLGLILPSQYEQQPMSGNVSDDGSKQKVPRRTPMACQFCRGALICLRSLRFRLTLCPTICRKVGSSNVTDVRLARTASAGASRAFTSLCTSFSPDASTPRIACAPPLIRASFLLRVYTAPRRNNDDGCRFSLAVGQAFSGQALESLVITALVHSYHTYRMIVF